MSKSSIICHSCNQDNDPESTFCIECGASLISDETLEYKDRSQDTRVPIRSRRRTSYGSGQCPWHMMNLMRGNPMMLIMGIVMFGVFIYFIFSRFFS